MGGKYSQGQDFCVIIRAVSKHEFLNIMWARQTPSPTKKTQQQQVISNECHKSLNNIFMYHGDNI